MKVNSFRLKSNSHIIKKKSPIKARVMEERIINNDEFEFFFLVKNGEDKRKVDKRLP